MAKPSDLTTLANFKTSQNVSGTSDDAWIAQIISRASGWIEQVTNRKLVARRYNGGSGTHATTSVADQDFFYFDGDPYQVDKMGYGLVYLPQYPVQPNTVLAFGLAILQSRDDIATTGDVWNTTQLLEGRDYVADRTLGAIRLIRGPFSVGLKNYRVTYAAGYDGTTGGSNTAPYVPDDLEELCLECVNLIYRDRKNLKAETIGSWRREFETTKEDPYLSDIFGAYSRIILPT